MNNLLVGQTPVHLLWLQIIGWWLCLPFSRGAARTVDVQEIIAMPTTSILIDLADVSIASAWRSLLQITETLALLSIAKRNGLMLAVSQSF